MTAFLQLQIYVFDDLELCNYMRENKSEKKISQVSRVTQKITLVFIQPQLLTKHWLGLSWSTYSDIHKVEAVQRRGVMWKTRYQSPVAQNQ